MKSKSIINKKKYEETKEIEVLATYLPSETIPEIYKDELIIENLELKKKEELYALGGYSLSDGEVFKDGKIEIVEKPSHWHKWVNSKWSVNLKEVKFDVRENFKIIRDKKLHAPLQMSLKPYKQDEKVEVLFQVEDKDLAKFGRIKGTLFTLNKLGISKDNIKSSKAILFAMGMDETTVETIITFLKTGALPWVLADNTTKIFEFEKLEMVEVAFGIREQQIFAKFIELDKKLAAAKTIEEIEAIKWE